MNDGQDVDKGEVNTETVTTAEDNFDIENETIQGTGESTGENSALTQKEADLRAQVNTLRETYKALGKDFPEDDYKSKLNYVRVVNRAPDGDTWKSTAEISKKGIESIMSDI